MSKLLTPEQKLARAVYKDDPVEIVRLITQEGANPNAEVGHWPILARAVYYGRGYAYEALVNHGANTHELLSPEDPSSSIEFMRQRKGFRLGTQNPKAWANRL